MTKETLAFLIFVLPMGIAFWGLVIWGAFFVVKHIREELLK